MEVRLTVPEDLNMASGLWVALRSRCEEKLSSLGRRRSPHLCEWPRSSGSGSAAWKRRVGVHMGAAEHIAAFLNCSLAACELENWLHCTSGCVVAFSGLLLCHLITLSSPYHALLQEVAVHIGLKFDTCKTRIVSRTSGADTQANASSTLAPRKSEWLKMAP